MSFLFNGNRCRARVLICNNLTYLINPVTFQVELLDGVYIPSKWGWTSEEERYESGIMRWPGQAQEIVPCNANQKLYGRAAFNRVLHEYKCMACSIEWPPVSEECVRLSTLTSLSVERSPYQWMTLSRTDSVRCFMVNTLIIPWNCCGTILMVEMIFTLAGCEYLTGARRSRVCIGWGISKVVIGPFAWYCLWSPRFHTS